MKNVKYIILSFSLCSLIVKSSNPMEKDIHANCSEHEWVIYYECEYSISEIKGFVEYIPDIKIKIP